MPGHQETEKRAVLSRSQYNAILKRLSLEATYEGKKRITDSYYYYKNGRSTKSILNDIRMDEVGDYSLRLREEATGNKVERTLNLKVITAYGDHSSWQEREVPIRSLGEMDYILKAIGFCIFLSVKKTRQAFRFKGASVLLEDIKGFGPAIEAEIITTKKGAEAAKLELKALFMELGIPEKQIVPKSITNILVQREAKRMGSA
jgi:predicted adenylyl cyclase CyaB